MPTNLTPGLKATTRALANRITSLESSVATYRQADDLVNALYAAHTAAYLRQFLAEFIGPTWHAWTVEDRRSAAPRQGLPHVSLTTARCPACSVDSYLAREMDRYVHADGSDNRACWLAISRGEVS